VVSGKNAGNSAVECTRESIGRRDSKGAPGIVCLVGRDDCDGGFGGCPGDGAVALVAAAPVGQGNTTSRFGTAWVEWAVVWGPATNEPATNEPAIGCSAAGCSGDWRQNVSLETDGGACGQTGCIGRWCGQSRRCGCGQRRRCGRSGTLSRRKQGQGRLCGIQGASGEVPENRRQGQEDSEARS
jgi:hypothetical protein